MADYHPLIARAVSGLEKDTAENRRVLYERARNALVTQLRGTVPALEEAEITRERLALEEAIRKVEVESARRARETPKSDPMAVKRAADVARRDEAERAEHAAEAARREDAERAERIAEAMRRDEAEQAERAANATWRDEAEIAERAAEAARRADAERAEQAARREEAERMERVAEATRREDAERAERLAEAVRREEVERLERAVQVTQTPRSSPEQTPPIAPEPAPREPARVKKSVPDAAPTYSWAQSEPGALLDEALKEFREVARSSSAQGEAARSAPPARPAFLSPIPLPPPPPQWPIAQPRETQPSGLTPPLQPAASPPPGTTPPDALQALESFEQRFSQEDWQSPPPGEHVRPMQALDPNDPSRRIPPYQTSTDGDERVHPPRSLRSYRWLVWAAIAFAVVAVCTALGYWQSDAIKQVGRSIFAPFRGATTQAQRSTTPSQTKIPDRIGQPDSTPPVKSVVVTAARAMLTTEPDASNPRGRDYVGSATWRTETIPAGPGRAAEVAIKLEVEIPDRGFAMTWLIRRNTDATLPASHTVDIEFNMAANSPLGRILEIKSLLMKQPGQAEGSPLWGHAQRSTPNYFLVGLSAVEADAQYNLKLLKGQPAFDVALVFSNVRRAFLLVEKGSSGDRVFADAFAAWKQ